MNTSSRDQLAPRSHPLGWFVSGSPYDPARGVRRGAVAAVLAMVVGLLAAGPVGPAGASPVGVPPNGTGPGAPGTVIDWAFYGGSPLTVPDGLTDVTAIAAGLFYSLALKADGTVTGWRTSGAPLTVPDGLTHVTAIAAGYGTSMALQSDGTVTAWRADGLLFPVPEGLHDVTAIAASGRTHMLALQSNGTVTAWANSGALLAVPDGLTGVTAIAAGGHHSLALKSDGTVTAWWNGTEGSEIIEGAPIPVPDGVTSVTAIAASYNSLMALKADGTVVTWSRHGALGVPTGLTDVTAIAASNAGDPSFGDNMIALKSDGTVTVRNDIYGQMDTPTGLSGVIAIAAGGEHLLAIVAAPDVTAPEASPKQSPDPNSAGWNTTAVNVDWNWTDEAGGSGINPENCTTTSTSTGEGEITLAATCLDLDGNHGEAKHIVKVDTVDPDLAPTLSPNLDGTLVAYGATVTATPVATDDTSHIDTASCGTVDTTTVGPHTVSCTATDIAGNTTQVNVDYVVGFTVARLSPPAKTNFKAGSTIPVKFTLTGADDKPIPAALATQLSSTCAATVTLNKQISACAVYDPVKGTFTAAVKSPKSLPIGTAIPIFITVTIGTSTIATGATSIFVTK